MKPLLTFLFLAISAVVFSQAPQNIPYQAVVRNTDGSTMANAAVTITFKIHDNSATGTVVYEETHATTTNAQGLVSLNVGGGTAMTGTFGGIQWGTGSKFLQVLMNAGNGLVDLGTQQMMSAPYALYAEDVNVRVSVTGDSLFIGDQVSIVPGVSAANPPALYTAGNGVNDIDGNYYPSIIINGQEWMQKNLFVSKYNNGDNISIFSGMDLPLETQGSFTNNNDSLYNEMYGKLYNWYSVIDSRGVCPIGWHVPNDYEWTSLFDFLDPRPNGEFTNGAVWAAAAWKMKATSGWFDNPGGYPGNGNNESGFSALPGSYFSENNAFGYDLSMIYDGMDAYWWSSSIEDIDNPQPMPINYHLATEFYVNAFREIGSLQSFFSIRCLKNSTAPIILGCTDPVACNFLVNANEDDGSCIFQNLSCENYDCDCDGICIDLCIGTPYQGGIIAYIFKPGDSGYVAGESHGIIAAENDLPGLHTWGCYGVDIIGANGLGIGTGKENTLNIIASGCGEAAQACANLILNGFDDWYLPSRNELQKLGNVKDIIGLQNDFAYWSSSEFNQNFVWTYLEQQNEIFNAIEKSTESEFFAVRPIRTF